MAKNGTADVPPQINKLVQHFRNIRDEIEKIEERHKLELAPAKLLKDKIAGIMLKFLDSTGQEMARTDAGTVSSVMRYTAPLGDPDAFMDYVTKNGAFELMDRRANSTACRDFAEKHGSLPPGVKLNATRTVSVKAPQ